MCGHKVSYQLFLHWWRKNKTTTNNWTNKIVHFRLIVCNVVLISFYCKDFCNLFYHNNSSVKQYWFLFFFRKLFGSYNDNVLLLINCKKLVLYVWTILFFLFRGVPEHQLKLSAPTTLNKRLIDFDWTIYPIIFMNFRQLVSKFEEEIL